MGIRPKLFLIFFACGILPMLFLVAFNYWSGAQAIEALLRSDIEQDLDGMVQDVDTALHEREAELMELSNTGFIRNSVNAPVGPRPAPVGQRASQALPPQDTPAAANVPADTTQENLRVHLRTFLLSHHKYYTAAALLDSSKEALFRAVTTQNSDGTLAVSFDGAGLFPGSLAPDERVWTMTEHKPLCSSVVQGPSGATLHYTVPIFAGGEASSSAATTPHAALIIELKLDTLYKEAASGRAALSSAHTHTTAPNVLPRIIVVLDPNRQIIYYTNEALSHQPVNNVMPYLHTVTDAMTAGRSGWTFYDAPEGDSWLAAYRQAAPQGVSVAVAGDYTAAMRGLRRRGVISLILSLLVGLAAAFVLAYVTGRTSRSIAELTQGAAAIAGGKLDHRIEVRSSDEIRVLADSVNQMKERLREQMRREAEAQQFQSFIRISAMLTHDLKNAIAGLSLLVDNMESRFDQEEFRADALLSLKESTNKLRRLVAKLSNPVETLSGEYKLPRPTDLVPIFKRVLATTAEPVSNFHEVKVDLPASLVAHVDGERIEKVFENLVINALEAMGAKRGRLSVEAGPAGAGEIFFAVADTGPGMTEEFVQKRLFRPFSTTKSKGVGLGLYTCREVVKAYGGRIEVETKKDSGTRFRVVLPLDQKIMRSGEAGQSPHFGAGSSPAST